MSFIDFSGAYAMLIFVSCLPVLLVLLSCFSMIITKGKDTWSQFFNNVIGTSVVLVYTAYPLITKVCLTMFKPITIDNE